MVYQATKQGRNELDEAVGKGGLICKFEAYRWVGIHATHPTRSLWPYGSYKRLSKVKKLTKWAILFPPPSDGVEIHTNYTRLGRGIAYIPGIITVNIIPEC